MLIIDTSKRYFFFYSFAIFFDGHVCSESKFEFGFGSVSSGRVRSGWVGVSYCAARHYTVGFSLESRALDSDEANLIEDCVKC